MIESVLERVAELWTIQKGRQLTDAEMDDFVHSMNVHAKWRLELAHLKNLSDIASSINDTDWQHEICLDIDDHLLGLKRKKPGRKGTD